MKLCIFYRKVCGFIERLDEWKEARQTTNIILNRGDAWSMGSPWGWESDLASDQGPIGPATLLPWVLVSPFVKWGRLCLGVLSSCCADWDCTGIAPSMVGYLVPRPHVQINPEQNYPIKNSPRGSETVYLNCLGFKDLNLGSFGYS